MNPRGRSLLFSTCAVLSSLWACSNDDGASPLVFPIAPASADADNDDDGEDDGDTGEPTDSPVRDARAPDAKLDGAPPDASSPIDAIAPKDASPPDADASVVDAGPPQCDGGTCAVDIVSIIPAQQPTALFVDATEVFTAYHLGPQVYRAPKAGGTAALLAQEPSNGGIERITGDGAAVFIVFRSPGAWSVDEINKSTGVIRTMYAANPASQDDIDTVVVDPTKLYVAAGEANGPWAQLFAIDRVSAVATPVNASWPEPALWLVGSGTNLYWADYGTRTIHKAAKSGSGSPQQIAAPGSKLGSEIVAEGGDVFYSAKRSVAVHKITGTTDVTLNATAVSVDNVWDVLVDAANVYLMTTDAADVGTVYRVPRAGGPAVAFATHQSRARGFAQDASYLYWAVDSVNGIHHSYVVRKHK